MIPAVSGRRPRLLAAAALVVMSALGGSCAIAAETQGDRDACEPDVFRLCMAAIPDETRIVACLNERANDLSPACRLVIDPPPRSRSKAKR